MVRTSPFFSIRKLIVRTSDPLELRDDRFGSWLCDNALAGVRATRWLRRGAARASGPDRRDQRLDADDVHDARQIVGEHGERHLGGDLRQRLHQEVRRAHARLHRAERMLDRLAPLTHGLRVRIETLLHGLEHVLVLPSRDAALRPVVHCDLSGHFEHAVVQ